MLVAMAAILKEAAANCYGVAAPNAFNLETIQASFAAARELKAPLIVDCGGRQDLDLIGDITRHFSNKYPEVTVALNLDHGKTFQDAVRAIRAGFTAVMVDRSQQPFEENVRETVEITKIAHAVGVSVEAELGYVGKGSSYESDKKILTDPQEAVEFVKRTEVDCLAVAIGTAHGQYVGTPVLDFQRLTEINRRLSVPLVLHGGSSTGDENLSKAVKMGIAKVNLFTDLDVAGGGVVKNYLQESDHPSLYSIYKEGVKGYKEVLKHYMQLFNSAQRD